MHEAHIPYKSVCLCSMREAHILYKFVCLCSMREAHIPLSNPTTRKDLPLTHEPRYLYTLLINTP